MSGRYFEDCTEGWQITERPTDFGGGVAPYAIDAGNAERLWDAALELIS